MALRCLHALCVAGVVARAGLVSAAPGALNDSAADRRPGAVRPSFDAPAVAAPAALEQTQNLAASEPAPATLAAAMAPNENSLAATVDLPDAAKPGAMRPGDKPREAPQAPPPESSFKVPALVDRPLEIDDGEKLAVKQFVLDGAIDRPQHGIAVADLQALVDAKLAERPDGFSVGRLQEVADAVTKYYRDRGLILAQAFVPVQSVDGGAVKIQIMEGLLGNVVTEGNKMYKPKVLSQPFTKLIGQPVTKESIESALLTVSDNPGLSSFGVFQPGTRVGTADIMLKVQHEKRFESALRWDNHGIRLENWVMLIVGSIVALLIEFVSHEGFLDDNLTIPVGASLLMIGTHSLLSGHSLTTYFYHITDLLRVVH